MSDKRGIDELHKELRDRFGPIPSPLQLLLKVAQLKIISASRGITILEVKDDKVMLTRNNDYIMVGNIKGVSGASDDEGAANLAGWRFIKESDFAAGAR